jgi:hypothetical protein
VNIIAKKQSPSKLLKTLRRRIELTKDEKRKMISEIDRARNVRRTKKLPEAGLPIGSKEQKRILRDLGKLRKTWR